MHSYLQNAIVPVLNDGSKESFAAKGTVEVVQKKCAELQMALLQMQQNMEIPEIKLEADAWVAEEFRKKGELCLCGIDDVRYRYRIIDVQNELALAYILIMYNI